MIKQVFIMSVALVMGVEAQQSVGGLVELKAAEREAVTASVQKLGNEVVRSNFRYAVEKMYKRWKDRQAMRLGSEAKLLASFNRAGAQMQEAGVTIDSFVALAPLKAYRVHPVKKANSRDIKSSADLDYEVMVFVPTRMRMTFFLQDGPKRSFIRESFQVAISKEGGNSWTFIDGATIRVQDLRSMFPLLPYGLELPKKLDTEVKR